MASFDEITKEYGTRGHGRGCPVCGATNTGAVMVGLTALAKNGSTAGGPGGRIGSKMRSFCEAHAAELFLELVAELEDRAGRTPTDPSSSFQPSSEDS